MNGTHANGDIDGVTLKQSQREAASMDHVPSTSDMTNGETNGAHEEAYEDPMKALELLKAYRSKDGISVHELMDETKMGGTKLM